VVGSVSDQVTQNHLNAEELPAYGGKDTDQGNQNHLHVEELPAGGGKYSDHGLENHSQREDVRFQAYSVQLVTAHYNRPKRCTFVVN